MKKAVLICGLVGFLVAMTWGGVAFYQYRHGVHPTRPGAHSDLLLLVWPTAIIMVDAEDNWSGYIGLLLSSIANGLIYAAVGFCVASAWKFFRSSRFTHR